MNHKDGYKVTIKDTERWTLTRSRRREILIEPFNPRTNKNTATATTIVVLLEVRQGTGNHKAQDVD